VNAVRIDGIELTLAAPDDHESVWIDYDDYALQLEAAWTRMSDVEPPLNPRMVGEPGLGKTTLACAVDRKLGQPHARTELGLARPADGRSPLRRERDRRREGPRGSVSTRGSR